MSEISDSLLRRIMNNNAALPPTAPLLAVASEPDIRGDVERAMQKLADAPLAVYPPPVLHPRTHARVLKWLKAYGIIPADRTGFTLSEWEEAVAEHWMMTEDYPEALGEPQEDVFV